MAQKGRHDTVKSATASPPLDEKRLNELALRYVGRFATTRAKLRSYLARKLRERGWDGEREPDLGGHCGAVRGRAMSTTRRYALAKSQSLTARGYGKRRVVASCASAGIDDEHGAAAHAHADDEAVAAALQFARRRQIGPFADSRSADPRQREKALAAMVRAGHGFALARAILASAAGHRKLTLIKLKAVNTGYRSVKSVCRHSYTC